MREDQTEQLRERVKTLADLVEAESNVHRFIGAMIALNNDISYEFSNRLSEEDQLQSNMAARGYFQISLLEELAKVVDSGMISRDSLTEAGTKALADFFDVITGNR